MSLSSNHLTNWRNYELECIISTRANYPRILNYHLTSKLYSVKPSFTLLSFSLSFSSYASFREILEIKSNMRTFSCIYKETKLLKSISDALYHRYFVPSAFVFLIYFQKIPNIILEAHSYFAMVLRLPLATFML